MECVQHRWRKLYEAVIVVGHASLVGWECEVCKKHISQDEITPAGIGGIITKNSRLVGPHGGYGNCSDGSVYKEQIYENGKLTIVRPSKEA